MARKYHHSRRGGIKVGKWVGLAGKIIGAVVIFSPTFRGVTDAMQTNPNEPSYYASRILFYNTGYDTNTGAINFPVATGAVASFAGGIVLIKLFSYLGKHLR